MNTNEQMREALERLDNKVVSMQCDTSLQKRKVDECRMIIRKALSLPPRQCDVGTAEEQVGRHCSMCVAITKNGTKGCDYSKCNSCFAKWSQMPYEAEEGGEKQEPNRCGRYHERRRKVIELKPCPFCGGKAEMVVQRLSNNSPEHYGVCCDSCYQGTWRWHKTEAEAAAMWNRRAAQ